MIIAQSMRRYLFLAPLRDVYFKEKYNDLSELVAFAQDLGILHSRIVERGYYIKMNFEYYQIQK